MTNNLICDLCKKELINLKVVQKNGRMFVVCLSCNDKGIYPEAEIKNSEVKEKTLNEKIKEVEQMECDDQKFISNKDPQELK